MNLRCIGEAYHLFLENRERKPSAFVADDTWMDRLVPYVDASIDLVCPSDDRYTHATEPKYVNYPDHATVHSYGVNNSAQRFSIAADSQKVLVVEYYFIVANVVGQSATDFWPTASAPRHNGSLNVLFMDGSVRDMGQFELDPRISAIYQKSWVPSAPQ